MPLQMRPASHGHGMEEPAGQIVPVPQAVQLTAPGLAYVPAPHAWHALLEDAPARAEN